MLPLLLAKQSRDQPCTAPLTQLCTQGRAASPHHSSPTHKTPHTPPYTCPWPGWTYTACWLSHSPVFSLFGDAMELVVMSQHDRRGPDPTAWAAGLRTCTGWGQIGSSQYTCAKCHYFIKFNLDCLLTMEPAITSRSQVSWIILSVKRRRFILAFLSRIIFKNTSFNYNIQWSNSKLVPLLVQFSPLCLPWMLPTS